MWGSPAEYLLFFKYSYAHAPCSHSSFACTGTHYVRRLIFCLLSYFAHKSRVGIAWSPLLRALGTRLDFLESLLVRPKKSLESWFGLLAALSAWIAYMAFTGSLFCRFYMWFYWFICIFCYYMAAWPETMHGMCSYVHLQISNKSGSNLKLSFSETYIGIFVYIYIYIHTPVYRCNKNHISLHGAGPRAQGPVQARPHVRIYGSYWCIYVYMYPYYKLIVVLYVGMKNVDCWLVQFF